MYDELIKALGNCGYPNSYRYCPNCVFVEKYGASCELKKLLPAAADAIEELQKQLDEETEYATALSCYVPQWIPVTERLPENGVYVLGRYKNNEMAVVSVFGHDEDFTFWRAQTDEGWEADCDTEPTHWMPLPEPPKEEA